jgi:hypothetical protein
MEFTKGTTSVFRGDESLGVVSYRFTVCGDGRVFGIVQHLEHILLPAVAGRVPPTFLPLVVGAPPDLHLSLNDGTIVDFTVVDGDGRIENGMRREGVGPHGPTM